MSTQDTRMPSNSMLELPHGPHGIAILEMASLESTVRELGLQIDYLRLRSYLRSYGITQAHAYFTMNSDNPALYNLSEWMSFSGYIITRRAAHTLPGGAVRRANADVDMAVTMLERAYQPGSRLDRIVVFCGDRDLLPAIESVKRRGIIVEVVGATLEVRTPHVSRLLRQASDNFLELRPFLEEAGAIRERSITRSEIENAEWSAEPATTGDTANPLPSTGAKGSLP